MNSQFIKCHPIISAFLSAVVVLPLVFAMYFTFEPLVVLGQESRDFTVEQEISEEISFTADPNNVTMDQTLGGLTGGISNGTTTFSVATNNPTGYNVTIAFDSVADGGNAMAYNSDSSFFVTNLDAITYDMVQPGTNQAARFGYTPVGPNVVEQFLDDGTSTCNSSGGTANSDACFFMQSTITSAEEIINSTDPTSGSGSENQVVFRVAVGQDPDPGLPTGTYTATATLTASINP